MKTDAAHDDWVLKQLADPEFAAEYLNAASEDDDPKTSARGNPTIKTLTAVLKATGLKFPDGHFKFPHLWPVKFPQAGRLNYQSFGVTASGLPCW